MSLQGKGANGAAGRGGVLRCPFALLTRHHEMEATTLLLPQFWECFAKSRVCHRPGWKIAKADRRRRPTAFAVSRSFRGTHGAKLVSWVRNRLDDVTRSSRIMGHGHDRRYILGKNRLVEPRALLNRERAVVTPELPSYIAE